MSNPPAFWCPPRSIARFSAAVLSLSLLVVSLLAGVGAVEEVEAQETQCPGPSVCSVTIESSSRSPAAITKYDVELVTPHEISPLQDSIVMVLDEDIWVPRAVAPNLVLLKFTAEIDNGCDNTNSQITYRGTAADVSLNDQDDPRHPTTISISHAIRYKTCTVTIPADTVVTVTFDEAAGISNPTEGGAYSWTVGTVHGDQATLQVLAKHPSKYPEEEAVLKAFQHVEQVAGHPVADDGYPGGLLVDWEIQLTHEEVGRGDEVTVIGRGYKNGTGLTFWRDANFDGVRDSGEAELCRTNVDGNDIGYCTFTVNKPPFESAFGVCYLELKDPNGSVNCNFINAVDGRNHSSILVEDDEVLVKEEEEGEEVVVAKKVDHLDQVLELVGEIVAEVGADRRLFLQLVDFPEGELISADIGGVPVDLDHIRDKTVPKSGTIHFHIDLPGMARRGYQSLRVVVRHATADESTDCNEKSDDCHEISTTIWVEPDAIVRVFPDVVLPNQRINVEGLGFTHRDDLGEIASISIGGHVLDEERINRGEGPNLTNSDGYWVGPVDLPVNRATTVPGIHSLRVTDLSGRGGSVDVTIPPREVTVSPIWGRPGSIVTVSGTGFPVRNDSVSNVNLQIYYEFSEGYAVASAETDINGNFSKEIRLPLKTPAPSSNAVRVVFEDENGIEVITTARHEVPGATVQLSPIAGPPGTQVTLTGTGFRPFVRVTSATIGQIDVAPGQSATADAHGEFSFSFLAPGIGVGRQTVEVTVAGVTASSPFDITLSGVVAGNPTPVAEALESLGDSFVRSFHFDNDSKSWSFYDPLFPDESDQDYMVAGETYLVLVSETVEAILNGETRQLTCHQGNCWNQVVW